MSLEVAARQVGGITVVDVNGNLWPRTDKSGHLLSKLVKDLVENGNKRILLNLKGVKEHDNSGVGELVACLKAIQPRMSDRMTSLWTERSRYGGRCDWHHDPATLMTCPVRKASAGDGDRASPMTRIADAQE